MLDRAAIFKYTLAATLLLFITVAGAKLKQYLDLDDHTNTEADYKLIREFLLNDSMTGASPGGFSLTDANNPDGGPFGITAGNRRKPCIWIHLPYETNSRVWESFYSRNTKHMNQPYLHFTVQSVIVHCGGDFNICLVDDTSFAKLLPDDWTIPDFAGLAGVEKECYRNLGLLWLVYRYGGIALPPSFLCLQNLAPLMKNDLPFIAEGDNKDSNSVGMSSRAGARNVVANLEFAPDIRFFGCRKRKHPLIKEWITDAEKWIAAAHTAPQSMGYRTTFTQWCFLQVQKRQMMLVGADKLGIMAISPSTRRPVPMTVDELFSSAPPESPTGLQQFTLVTSGLGIWIPMDDILLRSKYQWFASISVQEIFDGDYLLAWMFREAAQRMVEVSEKANGAPTVAAATITSTAAM